jgi:Ca2+:H+ antiporter
MILDKLRGQAKHAAWYDDPDDPPTYNPFRKVRTGLPSKRNTLRNAENGNSDLTRSITDQEHQHADALNRQAEMGGGINATQRFGTAPISDRSRTKPIREDPSAQIEIDRTGSPEPEAASVEKERSLPLGHTKESTSGDTIAAEDTTAPTANEKPRKRKGLKGMFHHEKEADNEKPEEDDRPKPHYTFGNQIKATLFNSWINILLLAGRMNCQTNLEIADNF